MKAANAQISLEMILRPSDLLCMMRYKGTTSAGPMADIAFLLLIFFLVTTNIKTEFGIPTKIQATVQPTLTSSETVLISVLGESEIQVDGKKSNPRALEEMLVANFTDDRSPTIVLRSDRTTSYAHYVEVFDVVRRSIRLVRNRYSMEHFGKSYHVLSNDQKTKVKELFPLKVSELEMD